MPYTDPYAQGGYIGQDGGGGDWDSTSDTIPVPSVPNINAVESGLITLYLPTHTELYSLSSFLNSNNAMFESWKAMFGNVKECILGLGIVPVTLTQTQKTLMPSVKIGNISTGLSLYRATVQFVSVSLGTVTLNEYYGSFLDYSPHTQIEIYLPYIGTKTLDADVVMGKTIGVTYLIDIATGMCVANITVNGTVMYVFSGECMTLIPITNGNYAQILQAHLNCAVSAITNVAKIVASEGAYTPVGAANMVGTTLSNAPDLFKPHIQKTGSVSTAAGMLSPQTPYLIITRTKPAIPENQSFYKGYQSFIKATLGNLSGYTEVESVHLSGMSATSEEVDEIVSILEGGFII